MNAKKAQSIDDIIHAILSGVIPQGDGAGGKAAVGTSQRPFGPVPGGGLIQRSAGPASAPAAATASATVAANDGHMHGVGDVNSQARGSGARFNAGKIAVELLPLMVVASSYDRAIQRDEGDSIDQAIIALDYLGAWQARLNDADGMDYLREALVALGDCWGDCADVFAYGARKYAGWNWAKGMAWSIPMACAARHLMAIIQGQENDPESGLSHRGHVFCNLAMLLTYENGDTYSEGDDRPAAGLLVNPGDA